MSLRFETNDGHAKSKARTKKLPWQEDLSGHIDASWKSVREVGDQLRFHFSDTATYVHEDAVRWLAELPPNSIHAIVTDPPYGLVEYEDKHINKRKLGSGGNWRVPPSFGGSKRAPLPRFSVLSREEITKLHGFFGAIAYGALRALVPGGHVFVASNPLLSTMCFHAFQEAGFEKRGEIIRQVQTLRGGYKPKGAEDDFPEVSVMPRSCWEPWGMFRKPFEGTVSENLKKWGTGGLRRATPDEPLRDIIPCSPTRSPERAIAPHPSLKPQRFMRQIVRASLPLGIGIVYDPFAGSGSTLAAAEAVGYRAIGTDRSLEYMSLARDAFSGLSKLKV